MPTIHSLNSTPNPRKPLRKQTTTVSDLDDKRKTKQKGLAAVLRVKNSLDAIESAQLEITAKEEIREKIRREIEEMETERDRFKALAREEHQRNRV